MFSRRGGGVCQRANETRGEDPTKQGCKDPGLGTPSSLFHVCIPDAHQYATFLCIFVVCVCVFVCVTVCVSVVVCPVIPVFVCVCVCLCVFVCM